MTELCRICCNFCVITSKRIKIRILDIHMIFFVCINGNSDINVIYVIKFSARPQNNHNIKTANR